LDLAKEVLPTINPKIKHLEEALERYLSSFVDFRSTENLLRVWNSKTEGIKAFLKSWSFLKSDFPNLVIKRLH
jgi:hypothetical protein